MPAFRQVCDNKTTCVGTTEFRISVNYVFPCWFLSQVLSVAVRLSPAQGPELHFRIRNVREDRDPIFECLNGDIASMSEILSSRRGSVLDITNGDSHTP